MLIFPTASISSLMFKGICSCTAIYSPYSIIIGLKSGLRLGHDFDLFSQLDVRLLVCLAHYLVVWLSFSPTLKCWADDLTFVLGILFLFFFLSHHKYMCKYIQTFRKQIKHIQSSKHICQFVRFCKNFKSMYVTHKCFIFFFGYFGHVFMVWCPVEEIR